MHWIAWDSPSGSPSFEPILRAADLIILRFEEFGADLTHYRVVIHEQNSVRERVCRQTLLLLRSVQLSVCGVLGARSVNRAANPRR